MKRKMLVALVAMTLILAIFCTGAMAASRWEMEKLNSKVLSANIQVKICVLKAQITPYNDVAWLLKKVDSIVNPVFRYAQYIGATVVCEYEYYWIDGQYVAVDPLKVINVGTGTKK